MSCGRRPEGIWAGIATALAFLVFALLLLVACAAFVGCARYTATDGTKVRAYWPYVLERSDVRAYPDARATDMLGSSTQSLIQRLTPEAAAGVASGAVEAVSRPPE